jgi:hypothetical protein
MEILLAWIVYIALGMACLALGWAGLGPRLPRPVRLAVLALCAGAAVLALAVAAQIPHDYRPHDLDQYNLGQAAVFTGLLVAVAGGLAGLAAVGRRRALNAGLYGAGLYVAGVGLTLYLMLDGQPTVHAPALVLVGSAVATAAALRLGGLPRWAARALGLAVGVGAVMLAEGLRGPGSRGAGPAEASTEVRSLAAIFALLLLLGTIWLLCSRGPALAGPLARAAGGLAGTALVLLLRGNGEWSPGPDAGSTTLYGLPLTLLAAAASLAIADTPTLARARTRPALSGGLRPRVSPAWSLGVVLPVFLGVVALWRPAPEACVGVPYSQASPLTPASPAWAVSPDPSAPRGAPQISEFVALCEHRTPGVSQVVYAYYPTCKWPEVDPNYPLVQASGTLEEIHLSRGDSPWLHESHDLLLDLDLDPASAWLAVGGGAWTLLHVEAEAGAFPVEYRPVPGDRVTVAGRWVFDCGHDPRTEIHPAAVVASEYEGWREEIGDVPQRVKVLRVWVNGAPGMVHVPLSPLDLRIEFPSRPREQAEPLVQVAAGPPNAVTWKIESGAGASPVATVRIEPPEPDGSVYFEVLLGYEQTASMPNPPAAYTVAFDRVMVNDDLRRKARNTTGVPLDLAWPQLGFPGTGRWVMQAIANHTWRTLLDFVPVESGGTYSLADVPPVPVLAASGERLSLSITGYAENDPSDGVELASGGTHRPNMVTWDAGRLADLCCGKVQTFSPEHGAWTLSYTVNRAAP